MADRAWDLPTAGGSILDQWPAIAAAILPQLPEHVQAVAFHADTGQLDLRPDSPAYAFQLRLITSRIIRAANDTAGSEAVRTVGVLPVRATAAPTPQAAGTAPAADRTVPKAPVKTRDMASQGFHLALEAHQAVTPAQRVDPGITRAVERQTRAMRELSRRAFPEPEAVPDDQPVLIEAPRVQRRREAAVTHAAAVRRARAERVGTLPHRTAPQSLDKTA
jgi:hypothetical protein